MSVSCASTIGASIVVVAPSHRTSARLQFMCMESLSDSGTGGIAAALRWSCRGSENSVSWRRFWFCGGVSSVNH